MRVDSYGSEQGLQIRWNPYRAFLHLVDETTYRYQDTGGWNDSVQWDKATGNDWHTYRIEVTNANSSDGHLKLYLDGNLVTEWELPGHSREPADFLFWINGGEMTIDYINYNSKAPEAPPAPTEAPTQAPAGGNSGGSTTAPPMGDNDGIIVLSIMLVTAIGLVASRKITIKNK